VREPEFNLPQFAAVLVLLLMPAALPAQGTPAQSDSAKVTELAPIEVTATRAA
jgi:hypothetical protein